MRGDIVLSARQDHAKVILGIHWLITARSLDLHCVFIEYGTIQLQAIHNHAFSAHPPCLVAGDEEILQTEARNMH